MAAAAAAAVAAAVRVAAAVAVGHQTAPRQCSLLVAQQESAAPGVVLCLLVWQWGAGWPGCMRWRNNGAGAYRDASRNSALL